MSRMSNSTGYRADDLIVWIGDMLFQRPNRSLLYMDSGSNCIIAALAFANIVLSCGFLLYTLIIDIYYFDVDSFDTLIQLYQNAPFGRIWLTLKEIIHDSMVEGFVFVQTFLLLLLSVDRYIALFPSYNPIVKRKWAIFCLCILPIIAFLTPTFFALVFTGCSVARNIQDAAISNPNHDLSFSISLLIILSLQLIEKFGIFLELLRANFGLTIVVGSKEENQVVHGLLENYYKACHHLLLCSPFYQPLIILSVAKFYRHRLKEASKRIVRLMACRSKPKIDYGTETMRSIIAENSRSRQFSRQNVLRNFRLTARSDEKRGCGVDLDVGDGAFLAAELFYTYNVTTFFGPICTADIELTTRLASAWNALQFNFWRDYRLDVTVSTIVQMSTMSAANLANNVAAVLEILDWRRIAVITCTSCFNEQRETDGRISTIRLVLQDLRIEILADVNLKQNETDLDGMASVLNGLKPVARVFLPLLGDDLAAYTVFLGAMRKAGMNIDEYASILPISHYTTTEIQLPWLVNGVLNTTILSLFEQTVVLVNNYYNPLALQKFAEDMSLSVDATSLVVHVQLFESMYVYGTFIEKARELKGNVNVFHNISFIRDMMFNEHFDGPFGTISLDANNQRLAPFQVYIITVANKNLTEFMRINASTDCKRNQGSPVIENRCLFFEGQLFEQTRHLLAGIPPDTPSCGYSGELCDQRGTIVIVISVMAAICIGFLVFLCVRKMRTGETAQMPWAISAPTIKFVDLDYNGTSVINLSIHSLHSHQETKINGPPLENPAKPPLGRVRQIATIEQGFVFVEFYKLKEKIIFDKHDMHWLFQGLDFIHTSTIGYHGGLTATQCLVDSHWILKISGFGISRMLFKWRHNGMLSGLGGTPIIPNSELHYYAPEVRRAIKYAIQRNKPEDLEFNNHDGQAQDMYSFGAILYEIIFLQKVVDIADGIDESIQSEEELGIFSESAEEKLPLYPTFPDDPEVHPDLVSLMHRCFNGRVDLRPDANMARKITDATLKMPGSLVDQMIKNTENYTSNLESLVSQRTGQLEVEQRRSDELLMELLPRSVINELKLGRNVAPKHYKSVTIMYSDIVGFTSLCSESQPLEVVTLLNGMFTAFDNVISEHKCYKVETIGDAYMVASGVPEKMKADHVREIASTALKQREFLFDYEIPHRPGQRLHCRWGFNSGSVFTGVVGVTAPRYCVFGSTVTLAAKMENSGLPDRIQMTLKSHQLLTERFPEFKCSPRGGVRLEGVGTLLTYWLDDRDELLASARSGIPVPSDPDEESDEKTNGKS
ncbi:Guanylate cyclase [Aphelenchoides besseyi]|nr:Guanylate cyclase [Aphelenchoides besseyi]